MTEGALFDLLTGRLPFEGATTLATLRHQVSAPPPRPAETRPEIPATLDDLVHALLAPRPDDRPANAAEVYAVLAPLCTDLPPIPGVLRDPTGAVRAYSAIVERVPAQAHPGAPPVAEQTGTDPERAVRHAEQLHATGEHRVAARPRRRLTEERARQYGDDDSLVFDYQRRAARAHVALGEHSRALRQLTTLPQSRLRTDGPDGPAVLDLRAEIVRLSTRESTPPPPPLPRQPPDADT
ncbi:hypothetical protein [Plantactinospora sp. B5E13]|uniref:hypothetical protein n=1 Tax=unclassified Plantactinospora TaxID=2631981 RepID=UPI00325DE21C